MTFRQGQRGPVPISGLLRHRGTHRVVANLTVLLCYMLLLMSRCAGTLLVTLTPVLVSASRMTGAQCCRSRQRVQPGVYTMALGHYREALVRQCHQKKPIVYKHPRTPHS